MPAVLTQVGQDGKPMTGATGEPSRSDYHPRFYTGFDSNAFTRHTRIYPYTSDIQVATPPPGFNQARHYEQQL